MAKKQHCTSELQLRFLQEQIACNCALKMNGLYLSFFYSYLESLGATLPPKPEAAKAEEGKCPMKEDTPAPPEPEGIIILFFIGIDNGKVI